MQFAAQRHDLAGHGGLDHPAARRAPSNRRELLPRLAAARWPRSRSASRARAATCRAIATTDRARRRRVVVDGHKVWVTAARLRRPRRWSSAGTATARAVVVVPGDAPGVTRAPRARPAGLPGGRARRRPARRGAAARPRSVLGGGGQPLPLLVTTALAYGRMSVAWGCVGILRACLRRRGRAHADPAQQFGRPLAEHQLVARHLADLLVAEQIATRVCEHASRCWDDGSPEVVTATVLAKHVSAGARRPRRRRRGPGAGVGRVPGTAHLVARAYRDAKLMEIIEGSTEICQLMLAEHALDRPPDVERCPEEPWHSRRW